MSHEQNQQAAAGLPQASQGPSPPTGSLPGRPEDVGARALSEALRVSFLFLKIAMAAVIALYLIQRFFYVGRDEIAIKLSFGRPVMVNRGAGRGKGYVIDAESGLNYCWPWEEVVRVPLYEQTLDIDKDFWFGWTVAPEDLPKGLTRRPQAEQALDIRTSGYLITGDVNIIHLQLRARYAARDDDQGALDYAFRFTQPDQTAGPTEPTGPKELLKKFAVEATIETVASWPVLDVRGKRRTTLGPDGRPGPEKNLFDEIQERVRQKLQQFEAANGFCAGIRLPSIEPIVDPRVPDRVAEAFDIAQQAESEKDKFISEARKEAESIVRAAEGRKAETLAEAQAYKNRLMAVVQADLDMLDKLAQVYDEPDKAAILRDWHYQRMVEELLGQAEGSFVLHRPSDDSRTEVRLLVGRPLPKAKPAAQEEAQKTEQKK